VSDEEALEGPVALDVATLGGAGLVAHELCTERVVHFLQVVEPADASAAAHES
jgi:hypothetical protein